MERLKRMNPVAKKETREKETRWASESTEACDVMEVREVILSTVSQ